MGICRLDNVGQGTWWEEGVELADAGSEGLTVGDVGEQVIYGQLDLVTAQGGAGGGQPDPYTTLFCLHPSMYTDRQT